MKAKRRISSTMRNMMILALFLAACGDVATSQQPLMVPHNDALPLYEGGKVLHPWHFSKPDRDRFPARPIAAKASDPRCELGDDRYVNCRVYSCQDDPCPTGTCYDVALMFDPDGSPEPVIGWAGVPVVMMPDGTYYQPLYQPTCLR